jgi:anaerobic selenocysteine-containing dehydrogenase
MTQPERAVHTRACNLCEFMCGLLVTTENGRIVRVQGDLDDFFSEGHVCPKAQAHKDLHEDPDRLRRPLVREGDKFRGTDREKALSRCAEGFRKTRREHGQDAEALYAGNPCAHLHGAFMFLLPLVGCLGTKNRFSAISADQLPLMVVSCFLFGHMALLPAPDIARTRHWLIIGGNPLVSGGSIPSSGGPARHIKNIRERGGKVVVVDPVKTRTAKAADRNEFIRPGTDALLLAAMPHTVFEAGLARPGRAGDLRDNPDLLRHTKVQSDKVCPHPGPLPQGEGD